ncbi:MAG: glutamate--tRNA ligase [candidate division WOR-3 bacterium]|nr:glutamate--tRNA ligase [candidate division WOR-3 bacterium]
MVRVRFAPSPTGAIHVGAIRSALYNWLFARHHQGKFVLRIEDTDPTRSTEESSKAILEGFRLVGIDWDEGPFFQSRRFNIYREYAQKLLAENKAYYCYCPPEQLEAERQAAWNQKKIWKYDRRCLRLPQEEKLKLDASNQPKALRFLVPSKKVTFDDLIHGSIEKAPQDIEDFILMRGDGSPTYNFAVVIDDALMEITHVIRAVEHIANTPKQILLYEALGFPIPKFAHLPLILGPDRKKLSKRHGALSLFEHQKSGILPEALINFLALLGWSPGGDREILTREEMIKEFSLERVNKSNAIFDVKKLEWMNSEYIKAYDEEKLYDLVLPFLKKQGIENIERNQVVKILSLIKTRSRTLVELANMAKPFLTEELTYDEEAVKKYLTDAARKHLNLLYERFQAVTDFTSANLEQALRQLAEELKIKAAELVHPCRVALTGKSVGPPLFETIELIGKEWALKRLARWKL